MLWDSCRCTLGAQLSPASLTPYCTLCTLIVSKAELLDGIEEDDDEIEPTELPINAETFEFDDLTVSSLGDADLDKEHLAILRNSFDNDQIFKQELGIEAIKVEPFKLNVDDTKWGAEARNRQPPRKLSHERRKFVDETVRMLLDKGCIEPAQVKAYSQVHVQPKKDPGDFRFCVDFRGLNDATSRISWPIPNIKAMLSRLGEKKPRYFAVMDLSKGYWQTELHPESRDYTAFITPSGCYRWARVPMGLKGSGSYFQAQMASVIGSELLYNGTEVYLDDILVYGDTPQEYLDNLAKVLKRFKEYGVLLSPKKCSFGVPEVEYVGHVINKEGHTFSDKKKLKCLNFPKPTTYKHMKGFIGLANYFRDNIPNMSSLLQPLQKMISGYTRSAKLKWTPTLEQQYEAVKKTLGDCQKLFWMDENLPVFLHTDASDYGCGAYLFQKDSDGKEYPIQFLSKSFSPVQKRWSTIEQEAYAIFYSLNEFEHLLRDRQFTLRTDHRNLLYLNAQGSAKVTRWKLAIQEFDFLIEHIPGPDNIIADAMSRLCPDSTDSAAPAPINSHQIALCMAVFRSPPDDAHRVHCNARTARRAAKPTQPHSGQLSDAARATLSKCHNNTVGHFGVERTCQLIRELEARTGTRCWQSAKELRQDVGYFVSSCPSCQRLSQTSHARHGEAFTISSRVPMEKLSIDTLGPFPPDKDGNIYIIVMIDCFSRYVELFPAADCTADAAAKAIVHHFKLFGVPKILLSDNGTQYANQVINELSKLVELSLEKSTAYSHEENGIVERANKEVLRHIRAILFDKDILPTYDICLPLVQRIMNATVHSATGFAPASIITPGVDLNDGLVFPANSSSSTPTTVSDYVETLRAQHAIIVRKVQNALGSKFASNKAKYDKKHKDRRIFPDGSFVLLVPPGHSPTNKIIHTEDGTLPSPIT
jgi:transposase InsO family protein